jgi:hypothetical protein
VRKKIAGDLVRPRVLKRSVSIARSNFAAAKYNHYLTASTPIELGAISLQ